MTRKKVEKKDKRETVTQSVDFAAVIRKSPDGTNKLIVKSQRWYQHALQKFKDGEHVTLEVHNRKPLRSIQQNRYYWGVYLPLIAEKTNEPDLDRLHELFKGKFLSLGVVEVLGERVRMKKSTTELSIGEFCKYIQDIHHLTDVEPPPTQNYGLPPLDSYQADYGEPPLDPDIIKF